MNLIRKIFSGVFLLTGVCVLCYFIAVAVLPSIYKSLINAAMWLLSSFFKVR